MKSQKILNDPVYGFITIPSELIFTIIDHPYFQRLRRIKQLGLTDFVYPGALHTRFHHALGAMHLMSITLDNLRNKGTEISDPEYEAALIAILLHDIGHGPFSHALEYSLLKSVPHEELSLLIIELLNQELSGKLDLTLRIFKNQYERKFFHQLVSSQLDIDRLDYLQRDCFFTGVSEGTIGADRIIKMMDVKDDQVVIEEKGIYSIENFLSARRLMYWQVYLHKTTVSAEKMLINLIQRAKDLKIRGANFPISEEFDYLLGNEHTLQDFQSNPDLLKIFLELDDLDLWGAIKLWKKSDDYVLRSISRMFLTRNLFKISLKNDPFTKKEIESS
nr:phosphohydrolase [Algoriphagus sp.]